MVLDAPLLTLADAAEILNVAHSFVREAAKSGRIPGFKVGPYWRFRKTDIECYLERRSNQAERLSRFEEALLRTRSLKTQDHSARSPLRQKEAG